MQQVFVQSIKSSGAYISRPALHQVKRQDQAICHAEEQRLLFVQQKVGDNHVFWILNFNQQPETFNFSEDGRSWQKCLDSADLEWKGPGSQLPIALEKSQPLTMTPTSFVLYQS
ncbi:MAG: DUF3459 domain-containing protein [Oscillatoriales cyanobacterium RM1_1_9]|nr:DUF3459 domain-containing protein [Oscillatoriales cyanobacterium RM1_1_9]